MPTSPSASPPLSPPPPMLASGRKTTVKPSSDTSDEPELVAKPHKAKTGRVSNGTDGGAEIVDVERTEKQAAEAKKRYQADLAKHAWEAPKAERPQDDWQIAYVWAFIVKFGQKDKIKRLECLEDFETALMEPVANRPDDILEGTLIRFLSNLKPGLRNLDCTNIQHHLMSHISEQMLGPSEFTVWDRPWAPNEEARGSCCNSSSDRTELGKLRYAGEPAAERLGRNPLVQAERKGGGLFELDWRERAGLLRQLVDWQLTHCEPFRAIINKERGVPIPKNTSVPENQPKVGIEPIGMDRNKQRIWVLDNSGRIYKSGNPFKRPCPIYAISSNKTEMQAQIDGWKEHGNSTKPEVASGKGKVKGEMIAARKAIKGIEDEKKLGDAVGELMEAVEKEDGRIARARKKIADNARIYMQAEFRSTRTRRTTKKIDYSYDDEVSAEEADDYEQPRRTSRRGDQNAATSSVSSKPLIPGERKSARLTRKEQEDGASASYYGDGASSAAEDVDDQMKVDEDEEEEKEDRARVKKRKVEDPDEGSENGFVDGDVGMNGSAHNGQRVRNGSGDMEGIDV